MTDLDPKLVQLGADLAELAAEFRRRAAFATDYMTRQLATMGKPAPLFVCSCCFQPSYRPEDKANGYCPVCQMFTGDPTVLAQQVVAGIPLITGGK